MQKAKRKLSDISFEKEGCHISLVGPSMGGPANGVAKALVLKALSPTGVNNSHELANPNGEGNNVEMIEKSLHETMIKKAVEEAVTEFKTKLEAAEAEVLTLKAAQTAQTEKIRKAQLAVVVGDAKVDETFAAIKSLDDAGFAVVLKGFEAAKTVESNSTLFREVGVSGKVDSSKVVEESAEAKILKAKFQPK